MKTAIDLTLIILLSIWVAFNVYELFFKKKSSTLTIEDDEEDIKLVKLQQLEIMANLTVKTYDSNRNQSIETSVYTAEEIKQMVNNLDKD